MKEQDLYDYCRWNDTAEVKKILAESNSIDVMYDNGILLRIAISGNENVEIVKALLDHYNTNNLQFDVESTQYKLAKHNLIVALRDAIDSAGSISEEMQVLLNKYLPEKEECTMATDNSADAFWDTDLYGSCRLSNKHFAPAFKNKVKVLLREYKVQQVDEFLQKLHQDSTIDDVPSQSTLYRWNKEKYNLDPEDHFERGAEDFAEGANEQFDNLNTANTQEEKKKEPECDRKSEKSLLLNQHNIETAKLETQKLDKGQDITHKNSSLKFKSLGELPESKGDKQLQHDLGYNSDDEYDRNHSTRSNTPPMQGLASKEHIGQNQTIIEDMHQQDAVHHREIIGCSDSHHGNE